MKFHYRLCSHYRLLNQSNNNIKRSSWTNTCPFCFRCICVCSPSHWFSLNTNWVFFTILLTSFPLLVLVTCVATLPQPNCHKHQDFGILSYVNGLTVHKKYCVKLSNKSYIGILCHSIWLCICSHVKKQIWIGALSAAVWALPCSNQFLISMLLYSLFILAAWLRFYCLLLMNLSSRYYNSTRFVS